MPVSSETEWTIAACGLIAHADGVLDGQECERLLAMIDEEIDESVYSDWLAMIGDVAALTAKLESLPLPAAERHRDVLEAAWTMAMVDGERAEAENQVLAGLASRLGVESVQLDFWHEAWTKSERDFARLAAEAACAVLGGGGPVPTGLRGGYDELVRRLPTTDDHRQELHANASISVELDGVARELAQKQRSFRKRLAKTIAPLAVAGGDAAGERFGTFGTTAGLSSRECAKILQLAAEGRL